MPPDPYATAGTLLAEFITAWDGVRLPDTRYVAEGGETAWDGAQLTVVLASIAQGIPGAPPQSGRGLPGAPVSATYTVEVVRARGAGLTRQGGRQTALPTRAEDAAAGARYGADVTAMLSTLIRLRAEKRVVSHPTKMSVGTVRPVGPQGDLVAVAGDVTILLGH